MPNRVAIAAIVGHAAIAHANGAVDEVSTGSTLSTSTTPGTHWVADRMAGMWDADPRWQLRFDFGATRSYPPTGMIDPNDVITTALSAEFEPDDHWSIQLAAGWSPQSTTHSSATILADGLPGDATQADVQLAATSSVASAALALGYDTAGMGDHETSGSLTVRASRFESQQTITSISDPSGQMLTTEQIGEQCKARTCSGELLAALFPKWTQLAQLVIDANVMQTEYGDADFGLDAGYYLYDNDPTKLGYFTLTTVGRGNLGNGIGIAPMQYTISPSVANRWGVLGGTLMSTLGMTYGSYVAGQGYDLTTNLRVQYKLKLDDTRRVKLYTKLAGSWGVDQDNNLSTSVSLALGAQYSW